MESESPPAKRKKKETPTAGETLFAVKCAGSAVHKTRGCPTAGGRRPTWEGLKPATLPKGPGRAKPIQQDLRRDIFMSNAVFKGDSKIDHGRRLRDCDINCDEITTLGDTLLQNAKHGERLGTTRDGKGIYYCAQCNEVVTGQWNNHCTSNSHQGVLDNLGAGWSDGNKDQQRQFTLTGSPFEKIPTGITASVAGEYIKADKLREKKVTLIVFGAQAATTGGTAPIRIWVTTTAPVDAFDFLANNESDVKIASVKHDGEMALSRAEYDKIKLFEPFALAEDNGLVDLRKVLIPDGSGKVQTFVLPDSFLERFKCGIIANHCDHTIISHAFLHNGMELTAHVMLQKDYVFQLEDTGFMFFYKGRLNLRNLVLGTKQDSPLPITDSDGGHEGTL